MANIHEIKGQKYVIEFEGDRYLQGWAMEEELFSGQSEFQKVDVVKTKYMGNMLLNDDLVMTTERDEFSYHEMICHVPMFTHPCPKKVLIIGGGDGGTAREVLRHKTVEKCVMVEIDKMVVDACRKYIQVTANQLDNKRLELRIDDGVKFVKETTEKFDVILVDSTDPIGPGAPLFGPEFYQDIKKVLNENGVVVSQGECAWVAPDTQKSLLKVLSQQFSKIGVYNYTNITYPGGTWSFTWASEQLHPIKDFKSERVREANLSCKYYNIGIHTASFQLPQLYYNHFGDYISI